METLSHVGRRGAGLAVLCLSPPGNVSALYLSLNNYLVTSYITYEQDHPTHQQIRALVLLRMSDPCALLWCLLGVCDIGFADPTADFTLRTSLWFIHFGPGCFGSPR